MLFKHVEQYSVKFRAMTPSAIRDYVLAEQPVGCAGSFKAETAGWRLFSDASGRDIRSLYGLPILALFDFADEQKSGFRTKGLTIVRADRPFVLISIGKFKESVWGGCLKIQPNHLLITSPGRVLRGFEA